jgi:PadR family transcriptional regulator PadR
MTFNNEFLVLTALARVGETYGRQLIDAVAGLPHGRRMSLGSLYPTLARMEDKGFVTGRWGDETECKEGARRRYYSLTADGLRVLNQAKDTLMAAFPTRMSEA